MNILELNQEGEIPSSCRPRNDGHKYRMPNTNYLTPKNGTVITRSVNDEVISNV